MDMKPAVAGGRAPGEGEGRDPPLEPDPAGASLGTGWDAHHDTGTGHKPAWDNAGGIVQGEVHPPWRELQSVEPKGALCPRRRSMEAIPWGDAVWRGLWAPPRQRGGWNRPFSPPFAPDTPAWSAPSLHPDAAFLGSTQNMVKYTPIRAIDAA
jgi:hypothetical protein